MEEIQSQEEALQRLQEQASGLLLTVGKIGVMLKSSKMQWNLKQGNSVKAGNFDKKGDETSNWILLVLAMNIDDIDEASV